MIWRLSRMTSKLLIALIALSVALGVDAQLPSAPASLPGSGLAQHDFLYAGESHDRNIFIVRGGKIAWSFTDPAGFEATVLALQEFTINEQSEAVLEVQ